MTRYLIAAVGVLAVLLSLSGYALKKSIESAAEARQAVKERDAALEEALTQKKAAEAAVESRDQKLTQIKSENRRYQNALKEALANDLCSTKPVPVELDRLLRDRFPIKTGKVMPSGNSDARPPLPGLDR